MPPPTTVPELLDRVRRSGIVPADRLEGFLYRLSSSGRNPTSPTDLLERLLETGLITRFHADKLAAGKYKGFQLGRYLILDQLGTGGMGQVYLAEHQEMRRLVALKVLPPQAFEHDSVARERFFREARAAAALDHPNVVRVFDLCQEGKLLYLVMEYVEGLSLQAVVSRHGPVAPAAACHYARQVAFGLQHAHELGFVHRDVKPANLLVDRVGVVKILDLGLVRSEADAETGLTKQLGDRSILGTADYVAPEQAVDSSRVDVRADIYSLGATLYFLLAGRPLFPEGKLTQKLVWQQIRDPIPLDRLRPDLPPALVAVVHRMLRKKPDDRPQTSTEVFDSLAPFVPEDLPAPPPEWMPRASARVAQSRSAVPGPAAPRGSGSTSQILAALMRSGSGSAPALSPPPPGNRPPADTSDTGRYGITPAEQPGGGGPSTGAVARDDTHPTLGPGRDEVVPPASAGNLALPTTSRSSPTTLVIALATALVLSLLGIAVLLLRG